MGNAASLDVSADHAQIRGELVDLLGDGAVESDQRELRFLSQDLFFEGAPPLAAVSPSTTEQAVVLVTYCRRRSIAIHPRGGGMSYSEAFQPRHARSIVLDARKLERVRAIDTDGGFVTVEAGCTWAKLDAELEPLGMRARFWGPMSGGTATVGGSLSQGAITFGSGQAGASANAVKSFEIVTGTGEILHTGSDGFRGTAAFNRQFGPDLTGLFANDAGALGIKTAATLEIEPRPAKVGGLSFAFDCFDTMARMFHDVTMRRLANEMTALDAEVARQNAGPPDLLADIRATWRMGRAAGNPFTAAWRMAAVALGGRRFLEKAHYTAHLVIEGRDGADIASRIRAVRGFARGGTEIVNTIPLMLRANPFPELPVTHPDGRRILPIHGVFPTSALAEFHRAYCALKAEYATRMEQAGVTVAEFFASIAGSGLLYEPVFYWADRRLEYHDRMTPDYFAGKLPTYPANDAARELVREMVARITRLMRDHGSTHFQIGRLYPFLDDREEAAAGLLRRLKADLDPDGIVNPGALGL